MTEPLTEPLTEGRTHWRRGALVALPALLTAGGLGAALSAGALALDLRIQDRPLSLATSSVYGTKYGAAVVDVPYTRPDGTTGTVRVLRMGFADGVINGLCLSQRQDIMGVTYTLLFTLGDEDPGSWEIRTENTVLDVRDATGVLDMDGIVDLNVNGADVKTIEDDAGNPVDNPLGAPEHRFGIQARYAKFDKITGTVQDIQIPGLLTTPQLDLSVRRGAVDCPAPPPPTGTPGTP
ncbi:cholesterol esterase [Streptomyces sp. JJ38]|nr:cholesterol esterase [Streptomyces sp. JJ38]